MYFLLRYWKFVWNSFYYPTSSMPYTSCPITSILFRGFRFRNFWIKNVQLEEINMCFFIYTKNETRVKYLKNHIKVHKLQVFIQRKYIIFVIRSIYVWNIKYHLYIVGSNRVTKVNNQKVNLINYVHIRQCLTFNGYPIHDWSCLSRCIKGFLRQPKISIFCWHSEVSKWI